jgi:quinolinate synthase
VIFIPDEYLAAYVATKTKVEIVTWKGHCEVHEKFTAAEIRELRDSHAGIAVLAHPECPPDVCAEADFVGSTTAMLDYIKAAKPTRVAMITECSMAGNLVDAFPEIEFMQPCNLCPHMRRITLPKIMRALETMSPQIDIDVAIAGPARRAVERMTQIRRDEATAA